MSFVKNDNQQLTLLDSTFNLTEREKRMLEKSWAKTFADKVFPAIDENIFSVLYSEKASRPNTPVNVGSSAIIRMIQSSHTLVLLLKVLCYISHTQYVLPFLICYLFPQQNHLKVHWQQNSPQLLYLLYHQIGIFLNLIQHHIRQNTLAIQMDC